MTSFISLKCSRNVENEEGLLPCGKYLQKAKSFIFCKHRVTLSVRSLSVLCIMLLCHSFARQRVGNTSLAIYFALLYYNISRDCDSLYLTVLRPFRSNFVYSEEIFYFLHKYINFLIQKFKEMVTSSSVYR